MQQRLLIKIVFMIIGGRKNLELGFVFFFFVISSLNFFIVNMMTTKVYMVNNFKTCQINQGMFKLARIFILIIKKLCYDYINNHPFLFLFLQNLELHSYNTLVSNYDKNLMMILLLSPHYVILLVLQLYFIVRYHILHIH